MEAKELRVGNYYENNGLRQIEPSDIDFCHRNNKAFNELNKPVTITIELLKRAGFHSEQPYGKTEFRNKRYVMEYSKRFELWELWKDCAEDTSCHIMSVKYMHTLQNIWPLINHNEELKLKS